MYECVVCGLKLNPNLEITINQNKIQKNNGENCRKCHSTAAAGTSSQVLVCIQQYLLSFRTNEERVEDKSEVESCVTIRHILSGT